MWWFNKEKTNVDPKKELEGLLKAQELLNQRFQMHQMTNETYIEKSNDLNKKIEKCRRRIDELEG